MRWPPSPPEHAQVDGVARNGKLDVQVGLDRDDRNNDKVTGLQSTIRMPVPSLEPRTTSR